MENFIKILGALGGITGIGIIWNLFRNLFPKKLYYKVKTYKNANEYLHVVALWNPTIHDILKDTDLTSRCLGVHGVKNVTPINYTDRKLSEILQINDGFLNINFTTFPKISGVVVSVSKKSSCLGIEGEIKNKQIQNFAYTVDFFRDVI